jgi:hypothetical protein
MNDTHPTTSAGPTPAATDRSTDRSIATATATDRSGAFDRSIAATVR